MERYAPLVARGKIELKPVTAAERHSMPHHEVAEDVDPLALLLAEREAPVTYDGWTEARPGSVGIRQSAP